MEAILAGLAGIAGAVAPHVGALLAGQREDEAARLRLEQERIRAAVIAQQEQVAARQRRTMLYVVGGVGAVVLVGFLLRRR